MDWNLTVSQALPWRSVLEVSYVANKSENEWIDGGNGKLDDLNNHSEWPVFPNGSVEGAQDYAQIRQSARSAIRR